MAWLSIHVVFEVDGGSEGAAFVDFQVGVAVVVLFAGLQGRKPTFTRFLEVEVEVVVIVAVAGPYETVRVVEILGGDD